MHRLAPPILVSSALGAALALSCDERSRTNAQPAAAAPSPSTAPSPSATPSARSAAPGLVAEKPPAFIASELPRIDVHTHVEPGALRRALALSGAHHVVHLVNLSGGGPGQGLEETLKEAAEVGHTTVFTNPDFREARKSPGYGARLAARLRTAKALGAKGVKIAKGLGLGYIDAKGKLLAVDDRGLDPMFAEAGKLGLPIAIHTGDPKAFWRPPTPDNERFDELVVHPRWSFFGAPVTWEDLYAQFERRVGRNPKTTFIGVHFGNDPEDPARVAQMLDQHPNLVVDTAARVPEIGRVDANHDADRMRAFFEKYQDRILFGTDLGVGENPEDLMLGSTGAKPPTPDDVERFYTSTWRWFETNARAIPSPTPIQGRWTIDGVALPRSILEKVYSKNAARVIGITY
jgi:predicted TIM-barrel fold metal-dependent hydrolase